jgi:hypothetical protein
MRIIKIQILLTLLIISVTAHAQTKILRSQYLVEPFVYDQDTIALPYGFNNKRQMAAVISGSNGGVFYRHAALVSSNSVNDIHTINSSISDLSLPYKHHSVNDKGEVGGILYNNAVNKFHYFKYTPTTGMVDLGNPFDPSDTDQFFGTSVTGINNNGQMVLYGINETTNELLIYCYQCSNSQILTGLYPLSLNDREEILVKRPGDGFFALIRADGTIIKDLSSQIPFSSEIEFGYVNKNSNIVANYVTSEGSSEARFITNNGSFDIRGLNAGDDVIITGLNDKDQVVGFSALNYNSGESDEHSERAFIWDQKHGTRALNSLIPKNLKIILNQAITNNNGDLLAIDATNNSPENPYADHYILTPNLQTVETTSIKPARKS